MKRLMISTVAALACALMLSSVAVAGTIKVGLMAPLTGNWASEGQDMKNIVELLAEDLNKAGGINGAMIEIVAEDDAGDPRTAALAAQKLSNSDIVAVIGTYGSAITEASQNIYDEAEIIQIATGSTAVRLTEKGMQYFFRTCPRDDEQGRVAAKVLKEMGVKKVAILHDNSSYAKGLADETKALLGGMDIVFYDALTPGERDYSAILTKLKGTAPEVVFFTGYYPEAGLLLRQMKEMKWDVPMLGGDAANNLDLVKIAGKEAAEGYLFVSPPGPADLDTASAQDFMKRYEARYGNLPGSVWSVIAGDAFKVIAEALKNTKTTDTEPLAQYMRTKLKNYPGLTGQISFNEKGDRVGDLYRTYRVTDGKFVIQP